MRRTFATAATLLTLLTFTSNSVHARGFGGGGGGFHGGGGGFGGGGFHGPSGFGGGGFGGGMPSGFGGGGMPGGFGGGAGGFHPGGGFAPGNFGSAGIGGGVANGFAGGARPDGFGGFNGAGANGFGGLNGVRPDGFGGFNGAAGRPGFMNITQGGAPTREGLNSFLGLPSDGGMGAVSNSSSRTIGNYTINHGSVDGPRGGEAAGTSIDGPNGGTAARGAAVGPNGGAVAGRGAEGPNGAGFAQGAAVGPGGRAAAAGAVRGPDGGVAARGAAVGPRGAAAGFGYVTPSSRYATGAYVRRGFNDWGIYGRGWWGDHPGAWYAAGLTTGVWAAATWDSLGTWFGVPMEPDYYDYGNDIVYENDNVYVNGQDAGTADQYYQQASQLASTGAETQPADTDQWMPLGVFAMTHSDQANANSNLVVQLAVNKQGIIRGNYTDTKTNQTLPIQGSVDLKTQRAAWTVGKNTKDVIETGLYNLTKDEAPLLVHFGQDRTEQWLLIRLQQPDGQQSSDQPAPSTGG